MQGKRNSRQAAIRRDDYDHEPSKLKEFFERLRMHKKNGQNEEIAYYKSQSFHTIALTQCHVDVVIENSLKQRWYQPLRKAIADINFAAPGLNLVFWQERNYEWNGLNRQIKVYGIEKDCSTWYNLLGQSKVPKIYLEAGWSTERLEGTALHELLHALGFQHEHQRKDGRKHLRYEDVKEYDNQRIVMSDYDGVTRFDPFSVMMYSLCTGLHRNTEDPIWQMKPEGQDGQCQVLSELDKLALNIVYRPVMHSKYQPKISPVSDLYYCGRNTFSEEIFKRNRTDGNCGPNNGPNCPACRVLASEGNRKIVTNGRWQGWTGSVYCNKKMTKLSCHDGYCGPDNGPPCFDCGRYLNPRHQLGWYEEKVCILQ